MATTPAPRLILNADDFGSCLAANDGIERALSEGLATSASVMVPCAWSYDACQRARAHPEWSIGLHLTLSCEWQRLRWRPVLAHSIPSLCGPDGFCWSTPAEMREHVQPEEALAECRAQIEQVITWGVQPTHLDCHMGVMYGEPEFFEIYLELATRYGLPVRLIGERELAARGSQARQIARRRGIRSPDDLLNAPRRAAGEDFRGYLLRTLGELAPGTTSEVFFHPAAAGPELDACARDPQVRARDLHWLTADPEIRAAFEQHGVKRISWRDL